MLELTDVHKSYNASTGRVDVLRGASLRVADGEFAAVQGPSGCGKTTLLLTAGGLLSPDGGHVRADGEDPYRLPPGPRAAFRARAIGFVFQQFHLVPYLSVFENILSPTLARTEGDATQRAGELMERFGLARRAGHRPAELSTGERQRAALARALLNRPRILLADEPTGNLDADNAAAVLDALARFAAEGGTVLLVTHAPQVASRAGRVLRLHEGVLGE